MNAEEMRAALAALKEHHPAVGVQVAEMILATRRETEASTKKRCAGLVKARRKRLLDDASDKSEDEHKRYVAGKRASEATKLLNAILALPSAYEGCSTVEGGDDG